MYGLQHLMLPTLSQSVSCVSYALPVTLSTAALSVCSSPVTGAVKRLATAFTLSTMLVNMFSPPCKHAAHVRFSFRAQRLKHHVSM